jgi:hypothetical protein
MPELDVVDDTWIDVPPASVAKVFADASRWRTWWPDFELAVDEARGAKGMRWFVRSARNGTLAGSMEVWLEPVGAGTVAHYFLRLDVLGSNRLRRRDRERAIARCRSRAKQVMWAVADELDPGRLARLAQLPRGARATPRRATADPVA